MSGYQSVPSMADTGTGRNRPRSHRATSGSLSIIVCTAAYVLGVVFMLVAGLLSVVSKLKLMLLQLFGAGLDVLSGLDTVALHACRAWFVDPSCQHLVTFALVVKGRPEVPKLRTLLQERLVNATGSRSGNKRYPRFTQHIARKYGYFVWVDDQKFTMDHRVSLWAQGYTDATLMGMLQQVHERPFAHGHSPWEVVLLPKMAEANVADEYVFLLRFLHSLGDGAQTLRIYESLFGRYVKQGSSPYSYYDDELKDVPVQKMPVQFRCNPFLRFLRNPDATINREDLGAIVINGLKTVLMAPWHQIESVVWKSNSSNCRLHAPTALVTGRKLLSCTSRIDLQCFKTVTAAYGCTINDVYLHCMTGAYQRCNGPSVQEITSKNSDVPTAQELPTNVKVVITINLLPESGIWGENCFAGLMLTLPSSGTDPAARLLEISQLCHSAKSSTAATGQLLLVHAMGNHLPPLIAGFVFVDSLDVEIGATNLRGPEVAATLGEDPVTEMFFFPNNFASAGVGFSFLSYNGGARIGVTVDRVVAPDEGIAQRLASNFVEELNNLIAQIH